MRRRACARLLPPASCPAANWPRRSSRRPMSGGSTVCSRCQTSTARRIVRPLHRRSPAATTPWGAAGSERARWRCTFRAPRRACRPARRRRCLHNRPSCPHSSDRARQAAHRWRRPRFICLVASRVIGLGELARASRRTMSVQALRELRSATVAGAARLQSGAPACTRSARWELCARALVASSGRPRNSYDFASSSQSSALPPPFARRACNAAMALLMEPAPDAAAEFAADCGDVRCIG